MRVHTVKSKGKISQNFVAFSEYMNFTSEFKKSKFYMLFFAYLVEKVGFTEKEYEISCEMTFSIDPK